MAERAVPEESPGPAAPAAKNDPGSPTSPGRLQARERDQYALSRRIEGATFATIGTELGVTGEAARKAVGRALARLEEEIAKDAAKLRAQQLAELRKAKVAIWPGVKEGDHRAVGALVRLHEREARLGGLDLQEPTETGPGILVIEARTPSERAADLPVVEGRVVNVPTAAIGPGDPEDEDEED